MEKIDLHGKFAIVHPQTFKKPVMVKLKFKKGSLTGIMQNNAAAVSPDTLDIDENELICVFPKQPPVGKVYNCDVEPFVKAMRANKWGNIYFYRDLADTEEKNLTKALDLVYRKFLKLNKITHVLPITLEVRPNKGNIQGFYRKEKKGIEHSIVLCPTSLAGDGALKNIQYLISHEIGHPFWSVFLDDSIKERWVRLYSSFNILEELTTTDLATTQSHMLESKVLPSEYRKQLEDKPKIVFNAVLKYIKNAHHLKLEHLDLMVKEKNSDLSKYWPKSKLHLSEMKTPISSYAGKNPTELFAECLACYATGAELPQAVKKLVKLTIKSLRAK